MAVCYEWDVEQVASTEHETEHAHFGAGDIMEHFHQVSYKDCLDFIASNPSEENSHYEICIVRDSDAADGRRSWAYVREGILDEDFYDAWPSRVCSTPRRFFKEMERAK